MSQGNSASTSTPRPRHANRRIAVLCLAALLAVAPAAPGEETATPLRIERVALFKNGLGFFSSQATLPKGVTTVELGELPNPAHGTFWVAYDKDTPIHGVFSRLEQNMDPSATSIADLLAANIGKSVILEPGAITGDLLSASPELALVRTQAGTVAVEPEFLDRVLIAGDEVGNGVATEHSVLRLELSKPAGGDAVSVSYLAKGITWAPSYLIDISDPAMARFSAKAVVINEAVDLKEVALDLVTGFPNLLFAEVASPMGSSQTLESFLEALKGHDQPHAGRGAATQQVMFNALPASTRPGTGYSTAAVNDGQASEDLFLYPVPRITLRRGETAVLPLLSAKMPYEHVYTWEIPDFSKSEARRFGLPEEPPPAEIVWHVCRLTNTAGVPLTTAPAQFVRNGQIVGQDLARYTHPGTATTIRINRALGLVAEQAELEISRLTDQVRLHGHTYNKLGIRGELKLRNMLGKPAQVEVTKSLSGEVSTMSDDPELSRTTKGLRAVNPSLQLLWKLDLEADEEKLLTYEYTILVRH